MQTKNQDLIRLPPDEIHLWFCHLAESGGTALDDQYRALLTPEEMLLYARFRFARERQRHLVTRAMVRWVLSRYAPVPAWAWHFAAGRFGRPRIEGPTNAEARGLDFNLSHTQGLIVLGVCRGIKIGVDVEYTDGTAVLDVVDHAFSPEEARSLRSLPAELQVQRFFETWTLKESFAKACGRGLQMQFDKIGFDLDSDGGIEPVFAEEVQRGGQRWFFWQFRPSGEHVVAVCAALEGTCIQIKCREALPLQWERPIDLCATRAC